jgi:hypothetical protein
MEPPRQPPPPPASVAAHQPPLQDAGSINTITTELAALTATAARASHGLCVWTLENVLLHQAVAQQLQVRRAGALDEGLLHVSSAASCRG